MPRLTFHHVSVRKKISFLFILIVLQTLIVWNKQSFSSDVGHVDSTCYLSDGINGEKDKKSFSPYEKIYIFVDFKELGEGKHRITTDWIKNNGTLERQNINTISLKSKAAYTYYSWLKLIKKGPLTSIFSGGDFDLEKQGRWNVQVYIEENRLCDLPFEVH